MFTPSLDGIRLFAWKRKWFYRFRSARSLLAASLHRVRMEPMMCSNRMLTKGC